MGMLGCAHTCPLHPSKSTARLAARRQFIPKVFPYFLPNWKEASWYKYPHLIDEETEVQRSGL